MLVLSRKKDEEIILVLPDGTTISLMTVDVRGDTVRHGITAPRNVAVHRKEVYEQILRDGRNPIVEPIVDLRTLGSTSPELAVL